MIIGHGELINYLLALETKGALGHAYIFFGDPQVGKFTAAKALAARLEGGEPQRPLTDARIFAPDGKGAIGIDTARAVRAFLSERPFVGARRTAIIDRAEALTPEAQNALLKVAEEPPSSALLILVMPDPELLWPTLRSRFQKIHFPPVPENEIEEWLMSEHGAGKKGAAAATARAFGKPGLALDLLEERGAEERALAARFFKTPPSDRKDFVKELTEPEDFSFAAFLDALIAHLAGEMADKNKPHSGRPITYDLPPKNGQLWHAVLELRRMQDATNLSPRIQLMNLWTLT